MGSCCSKLDALKKTDPNELTQSELKEGIITLLNNNCSAKMFEFLDNLYTRTKTVDYYYESLCTLPFLIIKANFTDDQKLNMLARLLESYKFNLNSSVGNSGNIIVNSVAITPYISIYELLIKYGADVNSIDYYTMDYPFTALDVCATFNSLDYNQLALFLSEHGAKSSKFSKFVVQ